VDRAKKIEEIRALEGLSPEDKLEKVRAPLRPSVPPSPSITIPLSLHAPCRLRPTMVTIGVCVLEPERLFLSVPALTLSLSLWRTPVSALLLQEIIAKKSYTGHMRFIGEIYVKDLVKATIMCYCVEQVPAPSPFCVSCS
jgi:hypothetical protein